MSLSQTLKQAEDWKAEKISQLQAHIRIAEALLRADRTDLAKLRKLEGSALLGRFSCESPAEIAEVMKERDDFVEGIHDLFEATMWVAK